MSGTKVFCPICDEYTFCESIPINQLDVYRSRPGNRVLTGVLPFLRVRRCNNCKGKFVTAEVPYEAIKKSTEYIKQMKALSDKFHA